MELNAQEFVINYLIERGAMLDEDNWRSYDFVSSGVIDSFETLSFLLVLKETFSVDIMPEDFIDNDYKCLGNLVDYINKKSLYHNV